MVHGAFLPFLFLSGSAAPTGPASLELELARFRAEHGAAWRAHVDPETGRAELLHGGGLALGGLARDEHEARALAEVALVRSAGLHGVDAGTLAFERVTFLPLGQIGSSDKWTVRYAQRAAGLEVEGAKVNVLLDAQGRLLSVHSTAVPGEILLDAGARVAAETALIAAGTDFLRRHGVDHAEATRPELAARRVLESGQRAARVAWRLELSRDPEGEHPLVERYWIDAATGAVLAVESQVHYFDVTGTVQTRATPGTAPDTGANPETLQPLAYARVQSSAGEVTTDANGVFVYPGVNSPLQVTVTYYGTYNDVQNSAGAEYALSQTIQPNTPTAVTMNPASTEQITSQANAMIGVNVLRDWIRAVNPADLTAERRFLSNVNLSSSCNAFFNGSSVNYYVAGGGCPNMAYSTIVSHEMGHWLNVLYGTGNGSDGMGEGNADTWAMYVYDTPVVGDDFFGPGSDLRTGLNTRPFCGDTNPGCHGGVHASGEVWMGAAWKVRARLNATLGDAPGDLVANTLFLGWMNAYNQTQIRSIIETQWLTLDDDDANLANGTPNFTDIDQGFRDQGFPGIDLQPLVIANVTELPDTENASGPYAVDATISANFSPPLVSALLRWRVNGGSFQDVPMSAQGAGVYRGSIPGAPYPALVQYFVRAQDSAGRVVTWPSSAPEQLQSFDVGTKEPIAAFFFDISSSGWTTGTVGDTSNPEVDWARGVPTGRGGNAGGTSWRDPAAAHAGFGCFANDLGAGSADGAYGANVHSWLRSGVLNCSGRQNVRLRFQSWLTVEGNAFDQARVLVNGVQVYQNPAAARVDTDWGMQEFDISAVAADNPSVTIEFRLRSNGTNHFGGWNVDDVEIFSLSPIVPPCPAPQIYCSTSPNSVGGGAILGWSGTGNLILNDFDLYVYACPPNTTGLFYYGSSQTQVPFGNGFRCVGGTVFRLGAQVTDAFGDALRSLDLTALPSGPAQPGDVRHFQFWYRNPAGGGAGFNLSNGLTLTVCN